MIRFPVRRSSPTAKPPTAANRPVRSLPVGQGTYSDRPGTIPVITRKTFVFTDRGRRVMWKCRTGFAGDAPDLFRFNLGQRIERWRLRRKRTKLLGHGSGPARSLVGRALSYTIQAVALAILAALAYLTIAVSAALLEPIETPEPDCRHQYNRAAEYVRHCDFHDGRGYVEVQP